MRGADYKKGDGPSYIDDAPETPAPVFAVRAFKTAFFGTPRPESRPAQTPREDRSTEGRSVVDATKHEVESRTMVLLERQINVAPNLDTIVSPAKGILLTPGTAATRRKTVSFGLRDYKSVEKPVLAVFDDIDASIDPGLTPYKQDLNSSATSQPRHSQLTKTLFELSKQKTGSETLSQHSDEMPAAAQHNHPATVQMANFNDSPDITVDLSKPRSRSGQHWKQEFEEYHQRSNREMKQIIQYGQNVKSYAVKKDYEATNLAEKLNKELRKAAEMEAKVSRLAKQLKMAQARGPEGETDQMRLIGDLAQQTALSVRYKQKAEQYKAAIARQGSSRNIAGHISEDDEEHAEADTDEEIVPFTPSPKVKDDSTEMAVLHAQLDSLRDIARASEDRAAKLESENHALKHSLARIKTEMMSYETRRNAREERLRNKEAKQKAVIEEQEKQLTQLTIKNESLRKDALPKPLDGAPTLINDAENATPKSSNENAQPRRPSISPRKKRSQNPAVDIWTFSSPTPIEVPSNDSPNKDSTQLPPSSVRRDIHRTLKEIDQNLVTSEQRPATIFETKSPLQRLQASSSSGVPLRSTALRGLPSSHNDRNSNIKSASTAGDATSPHPTQFNPRQPAAAQTSHPQPPPKTTVGRSASLMGAARTRSRATTPGSGRCSALTAERAAAAKARLARRSAEKRRVRDGG